nr:helix-turn-helix domain-containing protein [Streptomyces atratus]
MAEQVRIREIDDDEGKHLLRIIRRGIGSVVTWRRAQMVLLSAQSMPVARIAEVTFTSADRVQDVIHNFNTDGFDSLYPKYKGGRPKAGLRRGGCSEPPAPDDRRTGHRHVSHDDRWGDRSVRRAARRRHADLSRVAR